MPRGSNEKVLNILPDFSRTPVVDPCDLRVALDLIFNFGWDRDDAAWLDPLFKSFKARWDDPNTRTALFIRARALLVWHTPARRLSDALRRQQWATERLLGEESPHPALVAWDERIRLAATYPLTADGKLDAAFQQALVEARAAYVVTD